VKFLFLALPGTKIAPKQRFKYSITTAINMKDGVKVVVFDWDGVLLDSLPFHREIYAVIEKELGGPIINGVIESNDEFDLNWKNHYIKAGFDKPEHFEIASRIYMEEAKKRSHLKKFFPGVKNTLIELKKKYKLAIASNGHTEAISKKLKENNMLEHFDFIIGGDKITNIKPHPEMMLTLLKKMNLQPNEVIFIGDMDGDIQMAKSANVKSIAVGYGWHSKQKLLKEEPDATIDKPEELLEVL